VRLCNRGKREICVKKEKIVSVIKKEKRRDIQVYKRITEESVITQKS